MLQTQLFDEKVGNEVLKVEITSKTSALPTVYSLHGAGPSNRVRINYLAEEFARNEINVLRFDFSGQGDSSGLMGGSSLEKRIVEARAVSKYLDPDQPITLIGSSMAGHIAARLSESIAFDKLILFCPAAYSKTSENLMFDQGFTEEIRKPNSWLTSPVWSALNNFKGKLMIIMGSEDDIIPSGVIDHYKQAGQNARQFLFRELNGVPHNIHGWLQKDHALRDKLVKEILDFCES